MPNYRDLLESKILPDLAASHGAELNLRTGDDIEKVSGEVLTGDFFRVLGIAAAAGRTFTTEQDVVVLSDGCWRRRIIARARRSPRVTAVGACTASTPAIDPNRAGLLASLAACRRSSRDLVDGHQHEPALEWRRNRGPNELQAMIMKTAWIVSIVPLTAAAAAWAADPPPAKTGRPLDASFLRTYAETPACTSAATRGTSAPRCRGDSSRSSAASACPPAQRAAAGSNWPAG